MSNKLEAALGGNEPANSFTDEDNVQFTVKTHEYKGQTVINLYSSDMDGREPDEAVTFWASDAAKIIALITEAAK